MTRPDNQRSQPWFAVKSHGYGAGLPIRWEGWASLAAFMVIVLVLPQVLDPRVALGIIVLLAAAFVWLSKRKSDGPWRWRWGDRD